MFTHFIAVFIYGLLFIFIQVFSVVMQNRVDKQRYSHLRSIRNERQKFSRADLGTITKVIFQFLLHVTCYLVISTFVMVLLLYHLGQIS